MIVKMNVSVSGTRDGQPWPERGTLAEFDDVEAQALITNGVAVEASDEDIDAAIAADAEANTAVADAEIEAAEVEVEAAVVEAPETATLPRPKPKRSN